MSNWYRNLPDPLHRTIRTFCQAFLGVLVAQGVALAADVNDGALDATLWKRALLTAVVAGFVAAVTFAHNLLAPQG